MQTLSNSSAVWMASHTDCRIASIENVSVRREDTASSCSSAARWRAAAAASCALWTAIAA